MEMHFKPISTAPKSENYYDQILCRFKYPYMDGQYVYFVAVPNGAETRAPGYAAPEEWCELPIFDEEKK